MSADTPATRAARESGLPHRVVVYEPAANVDEAAERRGIEVAALIKTLVVRRASEDYVLVLVPGDREIDWLKLRGALGVRRISMAPSAEAKTATGYAPGTITPLGSTRSWPVVADKAVEGAGEISIGGGAPGVAIHLQAPDLLTDVGALVADVTRPAE